MFKRKLINLALFAILMGFFIACNKDDERSEPIVQLVSPTENSQIQVPDTLEIIFKIKSDQPINSVMVSIVNANYISVSGVNTITAPELEKEIQITKLIRDQQSLEEAPYYIKLAINDGEDIWNFYFKIQLAKRSLVYKGFYLYTRPGIQQSRIDFYNRNLNAAPFIQSNGEFVDSDISVFFNRLFLATELPHKLSAYALNDALFVWDADPQFPYPGYTDIQMDVESVYASMQNGQVIGYSIINGQQKMITERLADTFPERICVLEDYIVGDYLSRIGGNKILMTFYKETGVRKQRYPINFKMISMMKTQDPNSILLIGNINGKGMVTIYDATLNIFEYSQSIEDGTISAVCKTTAENVIMAIGSDLYVYNYKMKTLSYLAALQDEPKKIFYESQTKQIILMFESSLLLLSYPDLIELAHLEFEKTLKGLQFYYQYD